MWQRHWSLTRDPFDGRLESFVRLPSHVEAVARLVHTIESASRSASLFARAGLGKSTVLSQAIEATRCPTRRFARVSGATGAADLLARLANGLGGRVAPDASRSVAWRSLIDSARLCRWQGLQVVLAVDDCQGLTDRADRDDLDRLDHLDPNPSTPLTVLRIGRELELERNFGPSDDWSLAIRLAPLTRTESSRYLADKLESAGRSDPTFTPRGLTRLHALSGGIPRGLDRLATLALMAGADRGLEIIPPEIVDLVSRECLDVASSMTDA